MNGVMNRLIPIVFVAITFSSANAGAASFRFEQAGFDEGAMLLGEFSGTDVNGDHRLTVETLPGGLTGSGPPVVIETIARLPLNAPFSYHFPYPYTLPDANTRSTHPLRIAGIPNHHKGN